MAFTMKAAGVPVGQYRAKFSSWEASTHAEYGERVLFEFEVLDGKEKGNKATRFCSAKMTPKSALTKLARGLAGKSFEPGDEFDPDQFVGDEYLVIVEETDSVSTRVASVLKADADE